MTVPPPGRDIHGDGLFDDPDAGYGGERLAKRHQWTHEADIRLRWLHRYVSSNATLLEIGAATGEFVAVAEQAGHHAVGLETSAWAAAAAQDLTASVLNVDLDAWRAEHPDRTIDAAVMFHVLEHFDDPRPFLRDLKQVVRPGGHLALEVPNGACAPAREQGPQWWAARTEDHHFHYSPEGLRALLTDAGWPPVEVQPVAVAIYRIAEPAPAKLRVRAAVKRVLRPEPQELLRAVAVNR